MFYEISINNYTFIIVQISLKNSSYPIGYPMVNQNPGSLEKIDKNTRVRAFSAKKTRNESFGFFYFKKASKVHFWTLF